MTTHALDHWPTLIAESDDLIGQIDQALMAGFGAGRRYPALAGLPGVFEGQPLAPLLAEALGGLAANQLHERHFATLATARCAVLGAQYDQLRRQLRSVFGYAGCDIPAPPLPVSRTPLHDTTRHWLAELAISGLGRLNAGSITPFLPALDTLRRQAASAQLAFLLTGFVDEVLAALPLSAPDQAPARRWCDLWGSAMMLSLGDTPPPAALRVSGQLLPLGVELRLHAKLISVVVHGLLLRDGAAYTVRIPWSRFKVDALGSPEWWLLVPEIAPLAQALSSGRALDVSDMECQGGVVRWDAACVKGSVNMRLLDVATKYLAPGSPSPAYVGQPQAHERHPVQLAEPVVLTDFVLGEQSVVCSSGSSTFSLPLCAGWEQSPELSADVLASAEKMFGLIHVEQQRWVLRPLSIAAKNGKLTFAGQSGAKLLAKPPKTSSVAILQERASRLLRA